MVQLIPLLTQNPIISSLSWIQTGFTFLIPAYSGCPGEKAVAVVVVHKSYCLSLLSRLRHVSVENSALPVILPNSSLLSYIVLASEGDINDAHTHLFNGPFSRTTRVSWYQKGKTSGVFLGYTRVYGVYQPPGFFWQHILTSAIINKQGTFSPFATPLCVYPPPFLAIHHWVKPIWILLNQETVSGSGISWAICKSASRSGQITMPVPHQSKFFYRPDALPAAQATASKHWR